MDAKFARIKELLQLKEATDTELNALIEGGAVVKRTVKCSKCGKEGHTARTCEKQNGLDENLRTEPSF